MAPIHTLYIHCTCTLYMCIFTCVHVFSDLTEVTKYCILWSNNKSTKTLQKHYIHVHAHVNHTCTCTCTVHRTFYMYMYMYVTV